MAKDWQKLVATAPARKYQRQSKLKARLLARYVPQNAFNSKSPPSYLYASGAINRCNPPGVSCVYFGEGPETARAEFDSYYQTALTELGYYAHVSFRTIIDLEDAATRKHFGIIDKDFTRSYVTKSGDLIPLQHLGKAVASQKKVAAIRFKSNAMQKLGKLGYNVVVFQDVIHSPDSLKILEGNRVLEKWPKNK